MDIDKVEAAGIETNSNLARAGVADLEVDKAHRLEPTGLIDASSALVWVMSVSAKSCKSKMVPEARHC